MRARSGCVLLLLMSLAGCGSASTPSTTPQVTADAVELVTSSLPPIDGPFTGRYSASLNYEPPFDESGPGVSFRLKDEGMKVVEGWFVPDGLDPIAGTNASGRGIGGGGRLPYGDDKPLTHYFTRGPSGATIDVVLVVENELGDRQTLLIDDALFKRVE